MEKQTDFPELEGKYIKTRLNKNSKVKDTKIAGCCFEIGITFTYTGNLKQVTCLIYNAHSNYSKIFYQFVEGIKKGYLVLEGKEVTSVYPIKATCPFME